MDRREFFDRSRQEFQKRWDTLLAYTHHDFAKEVVSNAATRASNFFFNRSQIDQISELLRQRLPHQVQQIIAKADRILAHRFDLLGFDDVDYGRDIDWHLDAVDGKRAPLKPFSTIRYLDFEEVGDSKVTWELNRHQHLVFLAKAFRLTKDRRYAEELLAQWRAWQIANPYPFGTNWASSLEVAFRSLSWIWFYHLLEGKDVLPDGFRSEWLRAQAIHGRHLERYLSTYFSPNTHLLGEGVALFFLGTLCPELARSKRWQQLGWKIVLQESRRQVLDDGMHFERSIYYHVYAIDFFLHATVLASLNSISVPPELERTLEKMLDALSLLCTGGSPPAFGDDDGGRVFDPARNHAEHLSDPLAVGAVLFNRADFKSRVRVQTEESIWLLGAAGASRWDALDTQPIQPRSAALSQGGIYVLSNQSSRLAVRHSCATGSGRGHDHADALSVCLHSQGRQLLIDPGTYEYVGSSDLRNSFRGTAMHNTLRVDGEDQCDPAGPFSWKQSFRCVTEEWVQGETFDLFIGSHDGYQRLTSPVLHRRWVASLSAGIFLVRDLIEGEGEHQLDLSWHLDPDLVVHGHNIFRIKEAIQGFALLPTTNHDWAVSVQRGMCSPVYGKQSSAIILNYGKRATLPAEFVSVLLPLEDVGVFFRPTLRFANTDSNFIVSAYHHESRDLNHSFYFASPGKGWKSGLVASDAKFVCITTRPTEGPVSAVFCRGSYLQIGGVHKFRTDHTVERFEWTQNKIWCSDPDAVEPIPVNELLHSESREQAE